MKRPALLLVTIALLLSFGGPVLAADDENKGTCWKTVKKEVDLPWTDKKPDYSYTFCPHIIFTNKVACMVGGKYEYCCNSVDACMDPKIGGTPKEIYGDVKNTCRYVPNAVQKDCNDCFLGGGAWTSIGCIQGEPTEFLSTVLSLGIGIAGGIAFLLILLGGFQILTSSGNPEQLTAGKELVTSAVTGLILIIFSVFLLRIIGVNVLGLPGFAGAP
ncbi:hypothetical protein A2Z33_07555 [Candidatus Gottesmanbacteria bacterium RBG_16_52_11]|uniref:Uncharacterized protein n=1 Tax=Candidatus Gottesmanbacteria bacterium RBG_16_52_11 TaxID=1798374 RepID=A0A1F5YN83_9BACT|nr:MAG: hypothetical protein A2Z33_07555 [Candidatus Gottesmanbacteria bacterium RBG_16_52_11]